MHEDIETNKKSNILRKYYIDFYKIALEDFDITDKKAHDDVVKYVTDKVYKYINETKSKKTFAEYISNHNYINKKYKVRYIPIREKVELINNGEKKYIKTLIDLYKVKLEYNIELFALENKLDNKNELINKGKLFIENLISNYFNESKNINFIVYMSNNLKRFYFTNKIKLQDGETSIVIDNKDELNKNKDELYNIYYKLAKKRLVNEFDIKEEKFNMFLYNLVKDKIDSYFENNEKSSTLRNYMESYFRRNIDNNIKLLVEYNLLFNDFYKDSILTLKNKTDDIINEYIKQNNIESIILKYKLKQESYNITKKYLDECIKGRRCLNFYLFVNSKLNFIIKDENKSKSNHDNFDMKLALKNKDEEFEILLEELSYLKELYKNKYVYYTDSLSINDEIDKVYYRIIKSFIYDILDEKFNKNYKTYISNRIGEKCKRLSIKNKKKFEKNILCSLKEKYDLLINNYICENDMSSYEIDIFIKYMNNAFETYISKGYFDYDFVLYIKSIINDYNYDFAKEILEIKEYEKSNLKVLKRPNIK